MYIDIYDKYVMKILKILFSDLRKWYKVTKFHNVKMKLNPFVEL